MPEGLYDSDVGLPSQGEAVTDSKGSRLPGLQDYNYSAADSSFCGDDISSEAGNLSSPNILSTSPSSDKQSSAISYITGGGEAVLSSFSRYVNRSQARASMVTPPSPELQQHHTDSKFHDRDRCFNLGMGGNTEGFRSGTVVNRGGSDAHKFPGATGCILSNSSLLQGQIPSQNSSEDGQCIHKGTQTTWEGYTQGSRMHLLPKYGSGA